MDIDYNVFVGITIDTKDINELAHYFAAHPNYTNKFIFNHIRLKKETPKDIWDHFDMDRYFRAATIASKL